MASMESLSVSVISKKSNVALLVSSLIVARESIGFCICHSYLNIHDSSHEFISGHHVREPDLRGFCFCERKGKT